MSEISKVQASKEKCRRHRDNWKREALRLRSIIEGLPCNHQMKHGKTCYEAGYKHHDAMCFSCRAKAELNNGDREKIDHICGMDGDSSCACSSKAELNKTGEEGK